MKTIKQLAIISLLGFSVFSCGNDDDNSNDAPLKGLWQINQITLNDTIQPFGDDCFEKNTIEIGETTFDAVSYYGEGCLETTVNNRSYERNGNKLTIISDNEIWDITLLTSKFLKLRRDQTIDNTTSSIEMKFDRK